MEYRYNFVFITPHKEIILGAKGNDFLLEFPQVVVESDYMVSTLDVIRTYFPTVKLFSFGQWLGTKEGKDFFEFLTLFYIKNEILHSYETKIVDMYKTLDWYNSRKSLIYNVSTDTRRKLKEYVIGKVWLYKGLH